MSKFVDIDAEWPVTQLRADSRGLRVKNSPASDHLVVIRGGKGFCYQCGDDVNPTPEGKCPRR